MPGRTEKPLPPNGTAINDLARRLRQLRSDVGLTYDQLAKESHYSKTALQAVCAGRPPLSPAVATAFITACGQDVATWQPFIAAAVAGGPQLGPSNTSASRPSNNTATSAVNDGNQAPTTGHTTGADAATSPRELGRPVVAPAVEFEDPASRRHRTLPITAAAASRPDVELDRGGPLSGHMCPSLAAPDSPGTSAVKPGHSAPAEALPGPGPEINFKKQESTAPEVVNGDHQETVARAAGHADLSSATEVEDSGPSSDAGQTFLPTGTVDGNYNSLATIATPSQNFPMIAPPNSLSIAATQRERGLISFGSSKFSRLSVSILLVVAAVALTYIAILRPFLTHVITGTVRCLSGANVEGVWVEADAGGSGMAELTYPTDRISLHFSKTISLISHYEVHVGCGGSSEHWAVAGYSGLTDAVATTVTCDDTRVMRSTDTVHVACRIQ